MVLHQNGQAAGVNGVVQQSNISVIVFNLRAMNRSKSSTMYQCVSEFGGSVSAEVTLNVQCARE